jgi:1,4-alpha-glucan branching enzyme
MELQYVMEFLLDSRGIFCFAAFYDAKFRIWPARKFIGDSIRYMVEEFHIDGIRFDAARQIQNFDFLHWVVNEAKKVAGPKPFYCVAEFLPDEPCITNDDGPMDGCNVCSNPLTSSTHDFD